MRVEEWAKRLLELIDAIEADGASANFEFARQLVSVGEINIAIETLLDTLPAGQPASAELRVRLLAMARDAGVDVG